MRSDDDYEAFKGVAIEVFKSRNLTAIRSLKDFLTALPSPSAIRTVLLDSIYQLATQDAEVCRWVLTHRRALEPELNLIQVAHQIVIEQLQTQGLALNQDFHFAADGQLQTSQPVKALLLESVSDSDRFLLAVILNLYHLPD